MQSTLNRCVVLSDFNVRNLTSYLRRQVPRHGLLIEEADFGQVIPPLLDASHSVWREPSALAVVWTRPEAVIESFNAVLDGSALAADDVLKEVDRFAEMIARLASRVRTVAIPTWTRSGDNHGLGILDLRPGGIGHALSRMNDRLADQLQGFPNVFLLDASRWLVSAGELGTSAKHWYLAKCPFGLPVFARAAEEICTILDAVSGRSKKLLILDLDDTLWGGVVGETGWQGIRLGGHDSVGEALRDFQRGLKALQNRGVVLAVVSKNDESVALEAIDKHPEMLIRRADLAAWRINWGDKAQNIVELVKELNLGLDSAVFIDDNPAERGRVAEALPQVLVPDWPEDKMLYRHALERLACFDTAAISLEDRNRTASYLAQRAMTETKSTVTVGEWLNSLQLSVEVAALSTGNRKRVAQLLNKTNQMNLTTRRLTEEELSSWANSDGNKVWALNVKDRFADYGLTGIVSTSNIGDECWIIDFVLSCRVFGRQVESVMADLAINEARRVGSKEVVARFLRTEKNAPTLEFFEHRSGFTKADDAITFRWNLKDERERPSFIRVDHLS